MNSTNPILTEPEFKPKQEIPLPEQAFSAQPPSEVHAAASKPIYNQFILLFGLLIVLIGAAALIGYYFHFPVLRTYIPQSIPISPSVAFALIFLGIGIKTILDSHPYEQTPSWLWPLRYLGFLIPTVIGLYWVSMYFATPGFDILDISQYGIHQVSLLTACYLGLAGLSLFIFLIRQHYEFAVAYFVCIPALLMFNIGLLALTGFIFQVPMVYGFNIALPSGISAIMTALIILIGTIPFKGLMLPLLSEIPRARWLAILSLCLGIAVITATANSIAVLLQHNQVTDTALISKDLRRFYTGLILSADFFGIAIKVIGLRGSRYLSQSLFFAGRQEQTIQRERLKRQLLETINQTDEQDHLFQTLAQQIGEYFQVDRCLLIFYDRKDSNHITRLEQYVRLPEQEVLIEDLPKRSDVLLYSPSNASSSTILVRYDSPADFPDFYLPYAQKYHAQACLGFDFIQKERLYGQLILNKTDQPHTWTDPEIALIQEITQLVGVAIRQEELKIEDRITRQILEESERRFRLLVDGVRDYAIYFEDRDGIIHTWNDGAERLFGYKDHEIIGKPISTFFTQQELDSGLLEYELEGAIREGRFEVEGYRVRKDGSQFWANVLITAIRNQDGNLIGFSSIIRDVTERKQASEALVKSEARFRTIYESDMVGIFFWDRETGLITDANQAFCSMIDYSKEEILSGQINWQKITPGESEPLDQKCVEQMRIDPKGKCDPYEKRLNTKNGQSIDVLITGAYYPGQKQNGVAIVMNISEQKRAEKALQENQRLLSESNRDLEQFAAIASHDLQAPLRKVGIFCDMIYPEAQKKLSSEAIDLINRSKQALLSAQMMVQNLLTLSKAVQGDRPFRRIDLSKVLYRVLTNLDEDIRQKKAKVIINVTESVMGDEVQIEQLLQNLLSNALKYQPPDQEPVIQIESDCLAKQFCQLSIRDNGIGIPPEQLERIFKPFERLHGKSSPYEGSGVGLAICKRIVERHGGSIFVESERGQGAKFTVRLPYRQELREAEEEAVPNLIG